MDGHIFEKPKTKQKAFENIQKIKGKTSFFVDKIAGDFYTIVGLPVSMLHTKLYELGYKLSNFELLN